MSVRPKITYTFTDKAPAPATYSLLLIVKASAASAGIDVETSDISPTGRILASLVDRLDTGQRIKDDLVRLVALATSPNANTIKLPNISASMPQLEGAIVELQNLGYKVSDFPEDPQTDEEKEIHVRYAKILGSTVNPALHKGNSDHRAPAAVEVYACEHPHLMDERDMVLRFHTDYMCGDDFFPSEQSTIMAKAGDVRIESVGKDSKAEVEEQLSLQGSEVLDDMFMNCSKLRNFFEKILQDYKETGVVRSLHVKVTMVRIPHPIAFGHMVSVCYKDVFDKWGQLFEELGMGSNNGISNVHDKIKSLLASQQEETLHDIHEVYSHHPETATVDFVKGIINLHIPSDVAIDASIPTIIRSPGQIWDKDSKQKNTKAIMPESAYARIYQEMINFCKTNDALDPTTMGGVPNVGLTAQKVEEYDSHDKIFEMTADGTMRVVLAGDSVLMQHEVETGGTWCVYQTKGAPIRDWVKLAATHARQFDTPAIFWLDPERAHDHELHKKVELYLRDYNLTGLDTSIMGYNEATRVNTERPIRDKDAISVTGNVLRDYLTDLSPIMELDTSAEMLSIVPLMAGDDMYEAGVDDPAPEHVQQLVGENYLYWDPLGEFLALAVSLEEAGVKTGNARVKLFGRALNEVISKLPGSNKSSSRKVDNIDDHGSHFCLAMYQAQVLATQGEDAELKAYFVSLVKTLTEQEATIVAELSAVQGKPAEISGHYRSNPELTSKVMHPGAVPNAMTGSLV